MTQSYHRVGLLTNDEPEIHKIRDTDAFNELCVILQSQGMVYGRLLFLNQLKEEASLATLNISSLDHLVVTTRIPVPNGTPISELPKKRVDLTAYKLGEAILPKVSKYFEKCLRDHVILRDIYADLLKEQSPHKSSRSSIEFYQYRRLESEDNFERHNGGWYKKCYGEERRTQPFLPATTVAYLLYEPEAWENGPGLIVSFSLSGAGTLAWNHILRMRHETLFSKPVFTEPMFAMIELECVTDYPDNPIDLSFTDSWKANVLIEHYF